MDFILILSGVGLLLLLAEAFVPGGVLGIVGGLALLTATVLGFVWYGPLAGSILLVGLGGTALVGFTVWMSLFTRTPAGRKMLLARSLPSGSATVTPTLTVGAEGIALTPLRPGGRARFGEVTVDVASEADFLDAGTNLILVETGSDRLVVRKKP